MGQTITLASYSIKVNKYISLSREKKMVLRREKHGFKATELKQYTFRSHMSLDP